MYLQSNTADGNHTATENGFFDCEALSVTWQKTSENVHFKGENGDQPMEPIHVLWTASEDAVAGVNPVEVELDKSINN